MSDALFQYVIYRRPADYPQYDWVIRKWRVGRGTLDPMWAHGINGSLEQARQLIPHGLFCLGRDPKDDPVIAEVWI